MCPAYVERILQRDLSEYDNDDEVGTSVLSVCHSKFQLYFIQCEDIDEDLSSDEEDAGVSLAMSKIPNTVGRVSLLLVHGLLHLIG